jgi:hypothetical protein
MTGHALYGFKALMKRCQVSIVLLMEKTTPSEIACSGTVAPDKVLPCLSLLESALNSVCLDKYAVASKDSIGSPESGKRKAPCLSHGQLCLGTNAQKYKVLLGSVRLR